MESPPKPQRLAGLELHFEDKTKNNITYGRSNFKQCHALQIPNSSTSEVNESRGDLRSSETGGFKIPLLGVTDGDKNNTLSSLIQSQPPSLNTLQWPAPDNTEANGDENEECASAGFDLEIEGAIVENILERRLPQVISEVSLSEKGYSHELAQLEHQVHNAAAELKTVEEKLKRIVEEVRSYTRQIYVSDDDIIKSKREIESLEKEISRVTHEKVQTEHNIADQERELQLQQDQFSKYRERMSTYQSDVKEAEMEVCPVYGELWTKGENIEFLKAKLTESDSLESQKLLDGRSEGEIKEEMRLLAEEDDKVEACCADVLLQIATQKEKQRQLTQDTEVLHKRNAAMLRRLKIQLRN